MVYFLYLLFLLAPIWAQQPQRTQIQTIIIEFAEPLAQWVGFNTSALQVARQCGLDILESDLLNFHRELAQTGEDFGRQHIDVIRKIFKENPQLKNFFKCIVQKRNTSNQFFKEPKKYKYLAQFIKEHAFIASETFYADDKPVDKGYRLGRFFRAFFQYYYQFVLHPAETASTKLIRAMTPKIDLFLHQDISPCLSLDTSGKISENLQNLGIYNIYLNVPQVFNALKYMKLKQKCRSEKYLKMLQDVHKRLQKIDMFKIMYHQYNPWVEIAAQKYGSKQIEYIANIFCRIINNHAHYEQMSQLSQEDL